MKKKGKKEWKRIERNMNWKKKYFKARKKNKKKKNKQEVNTMLCKSKKYEQQNWKAFWIHWIQEEVEQELQRRNAI